MVLSIVGADRQPDSGYMRAKVAQEQLVANGGVPYTIIRATQFFEFLGAIADSNTTDGTVRLPSVHLQPIAAGDLAIAVADVPRDRRPTPWSRWPALRPSDWTSWSAGSCPRPATRGRSSPTMPSSTSVPTIDDATLTPEQAPASPRRAWTTGFADGSSGVFPQGP